MASLLRCNNPTVNVRNLRDEELPPPQEPLYWLHHGVVRKIPAAVLTNALAEYADWLQYIERGKLAEVPSHIGEIKWEQTV